jgi:hypothetical protein
MNLSRKILKSDIRPHSLVGVRLKVASSLLQDEVFFSSKTQMPIFLLSIENRYFCGIIDS